jgi:regulatory protein
MRSTRRTWRPAAASERPRAGLPEALDLAQRFLAARPRSEQEVRRRLARAGFAADVQDAALERLRGARLVDDQAFASYWLEQRQTFRPRGARLLRAELRQRGIDAEDAAQAFERTTATAEDDAFRAAAKRAAQLANLDEPVFRTRLSQHLARRGFDWDVITLTVERLWRRAISD